MRCKQHCHLRQQSRQSFSASIRWPDYIVHWQWLIQTFRLGRAPQTRGLRRRRRRVGGCGHSQKMFSIFQPPPLAPRQIQPCISLTSSNFMRRSHIVVIRTRKRLKSKQTSNNKLIVKIVCYIRWLCYTISRPNLRFTLVKNDFHTIKLYITLVYQNPSWR